MGCFYSCLYFCQQFHDSYIRDNKPVQVAISLVSGALLMVILLAIFGAFRSTSCTSCSNCDQQAQYNVLTKIWAQTVCKLERTGTCKSQELLPKSLTIHALSPRLLEKETSLAHCKDNDPFEPSKLDKELLSHLEQQWPNVNVNQDNKTYWGQQWTAHGTCTPLKSLDYFKKTIDLDTKYPIDKWLESKNIKPTNEKTITAVEFKAVLTDNKVEKDQFVIRCAEVHDANNVPQKWLFEVVLCVKGDSDQLTKCDTNLLKTDTCGDQFYFVEDRTKPLGPVTPTTTEKPTEKPAETTTTEKPTEKTTEKPVESTSTKATASTTNTNTSSSSE